MIIRFFLILIASLTILKCNADQDVLTIFPLDKYDQAVYSWIKPTAPDYNKPLLETTIQQQRMDEFYEHYFGSQSPWNAAYINKILQQSAPNDLKTVEQSILDNFSNNNKPADQIGYAENFRRYPETWIAAIAANINISQFTKINYQANYRAITIDNLHARVLPTDDPHFYSYKLAGQGYPFDNLQMSSLWAGTPVYVLTETVDHAWSLVVTPDYIAWVKSNGIAKTDNLFINEWQLAAKKHLAAITQTKTSIIDNHNQFRFSAYIGSVFPAKSDLTLFIPVADADGNAEIRRASVSPNQAVLMPQIATPGHFAVLMNNLVGRPYGWGNMYFYNDCSAELKSLYTPFGIWIPRHSSDQVNAGTLADMTSSSQEQRLDYLLQNGHKFFTIIYIGGHIVMYIGNYANPNSQSHENMAMTYQDIWGLTPSPSTRRAVIGQAVLFPMLLQYPEDSSLLSLANKKYFQVSYLDSLPNKLMLKSQFINLKSLMYP